MYTCSLVVPDAVTNAPPPESPFQEIYFRIFSILFDILELRNSVCGDHFQLVCLRCAVGVLGRLGILEDVSHYLLGNVLCQKTDDVP